MANTSPVENARSRQSSFQLSAEIVIEILCHVFPYDVLSMRKTCRFISNITKMRVVWLNALERMCDRHGVFKPTFPSERMSTLELEYAALGPRRFLNMVNSTSGDENPLPYSNRELIFRRRPPSAGAYACEGFYLATGGRFLLLRGQDDTLSLWDLGHNAYAPIKTYAVATLESSGKLMAANQSADGQGILLVTRQRHRVGDIDSLVVYEIRPMRDGRDCAFVEVAQLKCNDPSVLGLDVRVNPRVVVIRSGPQFFVWDWVMGRGSSWVSSAWCSAVTVLERTLLAHDEDGTVYNWDIPTLHPLPFPDIAQFPSVVNEPKSCIHSQVLNDGAGISVHIRCTATHRQYLEAFDPVLCMVYEDDGGVPVEGMRSPISLFSVRDTGHQEDPFLPNSLLLPAGSCNHAFGTRLEGFFGTMTSLYRCEESVAFCADTSGCSAIVSVLPMPTRAIIGDTSSVVISRRLLAPETLHEEFFGGTQLGFCPVSGRLAYRAADGSSYLRDFLSAPE